YSPDGRRIAVGTASGWQQGRWRIYDLWTGSVDHHESPEDGDLESVDWSTDGRWLAVGGHRYDGAGDLSGAAPQFAENVGRVRVSDAGTSGQMSEVDNVGTVYAVSFSHDSERLAAAAEDGTVRVWEVPSGRLLLTIGRPGDPAVKCIARSPDDR